MGVAVLGWVKLGHEGVSMPAATQLWSRPNLFPRLLGGRYPLSFCTGTLSMLPPMFWVGQDQDCGHNRAPQQTASVLPGQHSCAWQWRVGERALWAAVPAPCRYSLRHWLLARSRGWKPG